MWDDRHDADVNSEKKTRKRIMHGAQCSPPVRDMVVHMKNSSFVTGWVGRRGKKQIILLMGQIPVLGRSPVFDAETIFTYFEGYGVYLYCLFIWLVAGCRLVLCNTESNPGWCGCFSYYSVFAWRYMWEDSILYSLMSIVNQIQIVLMAAIQWTSCICL